MRLDFLTIWLDAIGNTFKGRKGPLSQVDQCLNCMHPVTEDISFCPKCGQKLKFSYVTIWTLFRDFFSSLVDLDNSVFRSLRKFIIPGFLTKEYMEGRRKKYLNPIRFFFVALVILFSVFTLTLDLDVVNNWTESELKRIGKSEVKNEYVAWRDSLPRTERESLLLDSLESAVLDDIKKPEEDTMSQNLNLIGVNMREYKFLRKDLFEMEIDTLLVHYDVNKFWERLVVSQYVRTMRNPSGAIQFFVGNILWGIVTTIFILGIFMKLLYIRRKRFYVEHVILLFNVHTFIFILLSLVTFFKRFLNDGSRQMLVLGTGLIILIYSFMSFKRYYNQGYFKTIIKCLVLGLFYFIIILVMISIVFVASILLYK